MCTDNKIGNNRFRKNYWIYIFFFDFNGRDVAFGSRFIREIAIDISRNSKV